MGLSNLQGRSATIVLGIVGATAFALQGYDQSVMNGLLTLNDWVEIFPQIDTINTTGAQEAHNSTIQGTVVALYDVGCAIGALSCMVLGDLLGRRRTVFFSGIISLIGIVLQASAFSLGQLIVGRIVTGLGVGGFTATVPMWVSECVKADFRGRLVLLQGSFAIGGIVIAAWLEFGMFYVKNNSANWRFPVAFQSTFAIIVISFVLFLPESPRWLVKKDRLEEARGVLAQLDGLPLDSELVSIDLAAIRASLVDDHIGTSSSPFSLTKNRHLHRTILAVYANFVSQMTGVNIVTFYSTTILQTELHYSATVARIISGCLQIWQFVAATSAIFIIDRFGRRKLLIWAAIGMGISQTCLAGLSSDLTDKSAADAALFFYFTALFSVPVGLFLVPYMYAAEITPLRVRTKVTAMSAATNWLFNFLVAEVTPIGFATISWRYYIIYAAISAFSAVVFILFFPETKGRTLEEIDEIFLQSHSIFDPVKVEKNLPRQAVITTDTLKHAVEEKAMEERVEQV